LLERRQAATTRQQVITHTDIAVTPAPTLEGSERVVTVNPLQHAGWDALLEAHPDAWFFHGTAWAKVLRDTYGHTPVYVARFRGERLEDLLPLMEVSSPWSGRRGVSLPFTDFSFPLKSGGQGAGALYERAMAEGRQRGWKYLECRSSDEDWEGSTPSLAFFGHVLELGRGEDFLFKNLDGSLRRGIRKAEAAGLRIQIDDTLESVHTYYALHCQTRRRHGLPPQPFRFFFNLHRHMMQAGLGFIVTARFENKPVAGAVFLRQGRQAIYKFGASDFAFQHLRPNNLLMWSGIRECAARGCARLHFGRTSVANEGLRRFKLGFGVREEEIKYFKYDFRTDRFATDVDRVEGWFTRVFGAMPTPLLRMAGQLIYPHLS
jgi:CelD/BcsL family acetyltransferase involved in cellulose biosynthesis